MVGPSKQGEDTNPRLFHLEAKERGVCALSTWVLMSTVGILFLCCASMQDGDIIWKHNTVQAKDEVHLYNTLCYLVNLKIDFKVTELMWLIFLEFLLPICLFQLSCKMFSVNEHGFTYMNFMEENNHIMSTSGREKYRMNNKQMRMDIIS